MKRRFIPAWECESADDYRAQFKDIPEQEPDCNDEDDNGFCDGDCDYWESNCYGKA